MSELVKEQIFEFIIDELGSYSFPMSLETQIENDLGITGDDAIDLIDNLSKRFGFKIDDFKPEIYFYPEPGFLQLNHQGNRKPLTLGHIYNAVLSGSLI